MEKYINSLELTASRILKELNELILKENTTLQEQIHKQELYRPQTLNSYISRLEEVTKALYIAVEYKRIEQNTKGSDPLYIPELFTAKTPAEYITWFINK